MKKLTKIIKRKHKNYRPTIGIITETPNGDTLKESVNSVLYYEYKPKALRRKFEETYGKRKIIL